MGRQGRSIATMFLVAVGLLSVVVDVASAVRYEVGGIAGWLIPSGTYYEDWLANKKFTTGDALVFKYPVGLHTVVELSKEAYTTCNVTDSIETHESGNDVIFLETTGDHYFACGIIMHCALGQKFKISVAAGTGNPSPKISPPLAGSPVSTPAPGSASGLHAAGALACSALMALAASLVF